MMPSVVRNMGVLPAVRLDFGARLLPALCSVNNRHGPNVAETEKTPEKARGPVSPQGGAVPVCAHLPQKGHILRREPAAGRAFREDSRKKRLAIISVMLYTGKRRSRGISG